MKRSRINPVSKKRQSLNVLRRSFVKKILNERMMCEARIQGCSYRPTDVHEILTRGRGGSIVSEENVLALCRNCHHFITVEPAWAKENGFVVSYSVTIEADLQAAERARLSFVYGSVDEPFEEWPEEWDDD
jgi:hypothetical protein